MQADDAAPLPELQARLVTLVRSSAGLMAALRAARALGLASWCIGAVPALNAGVQAIRQA